MSRDKLAFSDIPSLYPFATSRKSLRTRSSSRGRYRDMAAGIADIGKWAAGPGYGPVLSQTDLYLLGCDLKLHPILTGDAPTFQLRFNLVSGRASGFNLEAHNREMEFEAKDEPATVPRVKELIILNDLTPWCTIVRNEGGVTLDDVCTTLHRDYGQDMTPREQDSLPPRVQDSVRRWIQSQSGWYGPHAAMPAAVTFRRIDLLREKTWFDKLERNDRNSQNRLGFSAPNIFVFYVNNY